MARKKGKFITVEGGEGSGKTTQAHLIFDALNNSGVPAILTREPGGTGGAESIRDLLVKGETGRWDRITETLLYFAARRDHVEKLIKPALERGEWVVCDRFTDSTKAYQGYGYGVQLELIDGLHKLTIGDFGPDLTLVFDIDVERGLHRSVSRDEKISEDKKEDRYERMGDVFHKNVRRGFLEVAKANKGRCVVIDASDSIKEVHAEAVNIVNSRLDQKISACSIDEIKEAVGGN